MVSKITVIALVAIVACPILLGYAMAFEEHDKDIWDQERTRSVNGLINNDTGWTWSIANTYTLNGLNVINDDAGQDMSPYYNSIVTSPATSINANRRTVSANTNISPQNNDYGTIFFTTSAAPTMKVTYMLNGVSTTDTVPLTISASYSNGKLYGYYQDPYMVEIMYYYEDVLWFSFDKSVVVQYNDTDHYADPAKGWSIHQTLYESYSDRPVYWSPYYGFVTDQVVLTVDFGSISTMSAGTTYTGTIRAIHNGMTDNNPVDIVVHQGTNPLSDPSYMTFNGTYVPTGQNIGGNFSSTGNVYQFVFDLDGVGAYYISDWSDQIGRAQYYQHIDMPYEYADDSDPRVTEISGIVLEDELVPGQPMTYRVDFAHIRNQSYPVATDVTWDPNSLLLDDTASYRISFGDGAIGNSISWGGETYKITDGKITVGTIKYNVKDLVLDSRYLDGTRTNYINGRQISTGDNVLQLGGTWSITVNLSELKHSTEKITEWTPGKFAWNGVDQSFALMGLITCAAVFVGLGMYGARSGAKVGKLMIICGAAAFVFLAIM